MSLLKLLMLVLCVLNMIIQLLYLISIYLILLSFHLFLLGKLILVSLTQCIYFIYSLFVFIDLVVSDGFLAGCFSLVFVYLGHVLLLQINEFFIERLTLLFFFLQAFFERRHLNFVVFETFLVLRQLVIEVVNCGLVLGISFIHDLFTVLDFCL